MAKLALVLFMIFSFAEVIEAACTGSSPTWTSTPDLTSVRSCVANASVGDTITVSAGSATWSSQLAITKGITLQGAGIGNTVITAATGSSAVVNYTPATPSLNNPFRLTGFEFNLNNNSAGLSMSNTGTTTNLQTKIRIDHNKWTNTTYSRQWHWTGTVYGVFDNNIIDGDAIITPYHENEFTWTNFSYSFGTNQVMYFENNTFNRSNSDWYIIESGLGGRWVFRFNTVTTVRSAQPLLDAHGNQGQGSNLSNMAAEIYGNTLAWNGGLFFGQRGGKSVVFNNTFTGPSGVGLVVREEYADSTTPPASGPTGQPQHVSDTYHFNNYRGATRITTNEPPCCNTADGNMNGGDIKENVDYFQQQVPFTGASGVGVGTLASRPSTCTTGVGYWATDQGNWNTSGSGGQGLLYKCTSTNTWTLYYTPYTYPHPLRSGTNPITDLVPPQAPTGLRVS